MMVKELSGLLALVGNREANVRVATCGDSGCTPFALYVSRDEAHLVCPHEAHRYPDECRVLPPQVTLSMERSKLIAILEGHGIKGSDAETALDAWLDQRLEDAPLSSDTIRVAAVFGAGGFPKDYLMKGLGS